MKIIQNNPYRIAGLLSNSSAKELQKQKGKIKAFAKVGKEITSEFDFNLLDKIERTEQIIGEAFSDIEQTQDKVNNSLFWFLKASPFDETAISYLIKGDSEKAIEIWGKVTNEKEVNSKNFSAFNNIGTLKLLSKSKFEIKEAIEAKIKLIESKYFENFVNAVADQTFTIDNTKQTKKLIDELLTQFKNKYSSVDALELFSNCNGTTQKYLSKKFTEEPMHNIESNIESVKRKRKNNKSDSYSFGLKLFVDTKDDLSLLKSLLGISDLNYKRIADELAKEIMQCGIDCFNENQDKENSNEYLEQAMKLAKFAESIAVGKFTKDKAKDNINSLTEMKDRELSQAIQLLQSIKDAYETNEIDIKRQIKELEETDIEIKMGIKSINHSAVKDNIKNSIDWEQVNDLLREVLQDKNLKKIKESPNNQLKAEFIELTDWLKQYTQKNSTITKIISKYKKIPPKLSFNIHSSEITNTDNKPLYTKFIRYIGLALNIEVIEDSSVTFYLKYINPNGSIKRNSKMSPKGYSQSDTKTLNSQTRTINLTGWGNADKCTYDIGEHRIEIYVDEYLIHSKKYIVDLAPSEKLGKELKQAENKLNKIKKTQYFKSDLETANFEMSKIQKFTLFRGSSEKERQIQTQQNKIDKLIEKSKKEKTKEIKRQEEKIYKLKMELSAAKY